MAEVVYDHKGNVLQLISTDKAGGEGAISFISGDNERCAKIYHSNKVTKELHNKIIAMVNNPPEDPSFKSSGHRSIAWPDSILYADHKFRKFVGYTMPLVDTNRFFESNIYIDKSSRDKKIGTWFNWKYLFNAATNMASAIAAIHEKGHRVGDLRETNILLADNTYITFVDCDSFQVKDKDSGEYFYCRVGTPDYIPSELQKKSFGENDLDRYYSDLFALGVLVFKFLMFGVHPYSARGALVENAPSITDKIALGHFAYTANNPDVLPPAYAPPYNIIPESLRTLFRRCFVEGHSNPQLRPNAKQWFEALKTEFKSIKECDKNVNHFYSNDLDECPWCNWQWNKQDPFPDPSAVTPSSSSVGLQQSLTPGKPVAQTATATIDPAKIEHLRSYMQMAIRDSGLSKKEQQNLIRLGRSLGIPDEKIKQVLIEGFQKLKNARKPKPTPSQIIKPKVSSRAVLDVPITTLSHLRVSQNSSVRDSFIIQNNGGSVLSGKISTNATYVILSESSFDIMPGSHKAIHVKMSTANLELNKVYRETITIDSNGGKHNIVAELMATESVARLNVPRTRFHFDSVNHGQIVRGKIEIRNEGGSALSGKVKANMPWVTLSSSAFTTDRRTYISFAVDSNLLQAVNNRAKIEIDSNGGSATVNLSINVKLPNIQKVKTIKTKPVKEGITSRGFITNLLTFLLLLAPYIFHSLVNSKLMFAELLQPIIFGSVILIAFVLTFFKKIKWIGYILALVGFTFGNILFYQRTGSKFGLIEASSFILTPLSLPIISLLTKSGKRDIRPILTFILPFVFVIGLFIGGYFALTIDSISIYYQGLSTNFESFTQNFKFSIPGTGKGNLINLPSHLTKEAERLFSQGEYQRAFEEYVNIVRENPDDNEAMAGKGMSNFMLEKFNSAKQDLEQSIELGNDDDETMYYLSFAHARLAEHSKAVDAFYNAKEKYNNFRISNQESGFLSTSLSYMANQMSNLKKYSEAEKYLSDAIELNPGNPRFYEDRANVREELADNEGAREDRAKAQDLR